jgi:hypothetical protein
LPHNLIRGITKPADKQLVTGLDCPKLVGPTEAIGRYPKRLFGQLMLPGHRISVISIINCQINCLFTDANHTAVNERELGDMAKPSGCRYHGHRPERHGKGDECSHRYCVAAADASAGCGRSQALSWIRRSAGR